MATLAVTILFTVGATLTDTAATAVTGVPTGAADQVTAQAAKKAREIAANFSIFPALRPRRL